MAGCCGKRREDGKPDRVRIDRAVAGQRTELSPTEEYLTIWRLSREKRWGHKNIAAWIGRPPTTVVETMRKQGRPTS